MADLSGLLAVMTEMRRLVALPDNDFAWSAWRDHQAALADMDRAIAALTQGAVPQLAWLFAPTGPLQEVSLNSGWGAEFLALAARFDAAMTHPANQVVHRSSPPCAALPSAMGTASRVSAPCAAHARTAAASCCTRAARHLAGPCAPVAPTAVRPVGAAQGPRWTQRAACSGHAWRRAP